MAIARALSRDDINLRMPLPEAYYKVDDVKISLRAKDQVWITVLVFADAQARQSEGVHVVDKFELKTTLTDFLAKGLDRFDLENSVKPFTSSSPNWTGMVDLIKVIAYRYLKSAGFTGKDV